MIGREWQSTGRGSKADEGWQVTDEAKEEVEIERQPGRDEKRQRETGLRGIFLATGDREGPSQGIVTRLPPRINTKLNERIAGAVEAAP